MIAGMIAGAVGGGAQAVQGMAQQQIADESRVNLVKLEAEIAASKARAIEGYRTAAGEKARVTRAGDINTRSQSIIDGARSGAVSDAGTSEARRDAVTEAPVGDEERIDARVRAESELGYSSPKDEATLNVRSRTLDAQNQRLRDMLEVRKSEGQAGRDSREGVAAANNTARGERNDATNETRETVAAARAEKSAAVTRVETSLNSLRPVIKAHEESSHGRTPAEKAAWEAKRTRLAAMEDDMLTDLAAKRADAKDGGAPAKPSAKQPNQPSSSMPTPKTRADYDRLPGGTRYQAPDGSFKVKG